MIWRSIAERSDDQEVDRHGINREFGHPRALELVPDDFFWDCVDELGPFGSDEGDTALEEYRGWRREHPNAPLLECLTWTIEQVSEADFEDYTDGIARKQRLLEQLADHTFDHQHFIYTVDISVIATGFGQLADEGKIDQSAKPTIQKSVKPADCLFESHRLVQRV